MVDFIREHWVQDLIGATVAALLGLALSFYLGAKWSTPESVREERIEAEQQRDEEMDDLAFDSEDVSTGK